MATIKQIEANRRNAQKSTGPKTPAGKARSSRNAFIHGLSSQRPIVTIENPAEFNAFANKFMDQYEPLEPSEIFLVRRIACLAWRIQRAQCYETLVLDNLCCSIPEDDVRTDQEVFSQLLLDDFRSHQTLAKLQRYESQLERSILRCMKELRDSRKAGDVNYTDVAYYLRDGQPRGDYKDLITPYGQEGPDSSSVAQASVLERNSIPPQADSTSNPVDRVDPANKNDSSLPTVPSVTEPHLDRRAGVEQQDPVDSRSTKPDLVRPNEPNALCLDGLTNPDLPWIPVENKIYKTENQRIRNNPNKQKWNYDYTPDWYRRVLDAVHFSPKKRKTMTNRDLEKHAECILQTFKNPEQFLLDIRAITPYGQEGPNSSSVAQASVLERNSIPPQVDSTSNPVDRVDSANKNDSSLPTVPSVAEPHLARRTGVEQQDPVNSRSTKPDLVRPNEPNLDCRACVEWCYPASSCA